MIAHLQLAVLYLAPVLVLLLALCSGRYPGERLIGRLAGQPRRPRRRAAAAPRAPCFDPPRLSGGRLLACRLAGRAPPVAVVP